MGSTAAPNSITCWGTTIKAALAFAEERQANCSRRILARMRPETRAAVAGTILPSSHYPLQALVDLLEAIDAELGRGDLLLCAEIGRFSASYQVNVLHRAFLAIASLDFWFRMTGSMWRTYYSAGTLSAESVTDTGGRVVLTDFAPISKAFCIRFGGWLQRICEMSKLDQVVVSHTACVLDGAPACLWEGSWQKR